MVADSSLGFGSVSKDVLEDRNQAREDSTQESG